MIINFYNLNKIKQPVLGNIVIYCILVPPCKTNSKTPENEKSYRFNVCYGNFLPVIINPCSKY